ncbi:MAG: hypothetical protein WAU70_09520 [Flavobacteriales bacterium]
MKKSNRTVPAFKAALLSTALLVLPILLSSCQNKDVVAPAGTTVDDHGNGGHGSDDPPGDDHGGQ